LFSLRRDTIIHNKFYLIYILYIWHHILYRYLFLTEHAFYVFVCILLYNMLAIWWDYSDYTMLKNSYLYCKRLCRKQSWWMTVNQLARAWDVWSHDRRIEKLHAFHQWTCPISYILGTPIKKQTHFLVKPSLSQNRSYQMKLIKNINVHSSHKVLSISPFTPHEKTENIILRNVESIYSTQLLYNLARFVLIYI
jgi:hypothetical protein